MNPENETLHRECCELLNRLENRLEMPMVILGIAWLILLVFRHGGLSQISP